MSLGALSDAGARELLDPASPVRHHYEELADNLLGVEETGIVVVTSPDSGAGRTSICLGLGAAVAGMGRRAAIVDCNLENSQLHRMLGEPNFVGLTSALGDSKTLEHHGYEVVPGLLVVPTGPILSDPASILENEGILKAVRYLRKSRDLVLLDAPVAGGVLRSPNLLGGFDGVLLVVHASRTPKDAAREAADALLAAGVNLLGVVLNGCS
ncbi:MAG TPA: CpsD/CapB family tyrosine-protein kinase [Rubrobacter sp.]